MHPLLSSPLLLLALATRHATAAIPQVDFDRMGRVGLAGAFAGLDLFSNTSISFDPASATLLQRSNDGALSRLASTNPGGSILSGCALNDVFYFAGSFSSVNGIDIANVASYTPESSSFSQVGSNPPNGQVNALFCDSKEGRLWAGGKFASPGASVAVYDPKAGSWSSAPFGGIAGAQAAVSSITTNSSGSSLFFSGSFIAAFGNANLALNGTNNPRVPQSIGATPFSSSLVPVPLQGAQIDGSPSSSVSGFTDISNTLCPSGDDGPGQSWFAADNSTPLITVRTFSFISASGVRLGNTFQANHGTTGFTVTTLPDNQVRTLKYLDPTTGQNVTCSNPCPLSTDSSVLYQDFLFDSALPITGVQIKITDFTGSGPGLHILQLLSSGAFASALDANNQRSCFATTSSNVTFTGTWAPKENQDTGIPGTPQTILISDVPVGTAADNGPTFSWRPYVSAAGNYDVNILVPGCTKFLDCARRTSVQVTVFPGRDLGVVVRDISQQNTEDATVSLYSGPILPSDDDFTMTVTMKLTNPPVGRGQNGQYTIVADRISLVLNSANVSSSDDSTGAPGSGAPGLGRGFGFLEWPRNSLDTSNSFDGRRAFPNNTLTALDSVGFDIFSGIGGVSSSSEQTLNSVVHHSSGIFVGGNFNLTNGPASGSSNIVSYKNGALTALADSGLNGAVSTMVLAGDLLFVGGAFTDTKSGSTQGKLAHVAVYDVQQNSWNSLGEGVDGPVVSLNIAGNQIQVAGNFTSLKGSSGKDVNGFAVWDYNSNAWVNSGGFVVGQMTFAGNGSETQYVAGKVAASQKYGASGLIMLKNGGNGGPTVEPLSVGLSGSVSSGRSSTPLRRRDAKPATTSWLAHMKFKHLFARQSPSQTPAPLTSPLPASAPAVLAGAFWTNGTSSKEVVIVGGNFSFVASGSSSVSEGVAIYNPSTSTLTGLVGQQINGTVRALLVDGNSLYIGGQFTVPGTSANGLALYDLAKNEWNLDAFGALQGSAGSQVIVRSITKSASKENTIIVAGSFAQANELRCQAICSLDTSSRQWNALGSGIQGEVASIAYAGNNQDILIAAGSISLDSSASNVAQYSIVNGTWTAVGSGSDIPGTVSAVEVNSGNSSSVFAAGQSTDGNTFLSFWDGVKWATLSSSLAEGSSVAQLTMVPLQNTHSGNGVIQADRMLMISGALSTSSGNASSVLYDGSEIIPYIVSTSSSGAPGFVSSLFHSFSTFSFNQRKFLATGVVILISIAIAAGVVFLLALLGILWTLFSRKDDKLAKFDAAEEDDDDSTNHRPSSLLEHINAATRTTILGATASPYSHYGADKEEEKLAAAKGDSDPFGPDASNYMRAETPSDAVGGILAEENSRPAHARYSFDGTGEGELPISAGAEVEVLDDRDPAWWYARDPRTGQEGVVPAAYLY